ncbi:MAG: hypothetical protein JWR33_2165 [Naasia sp.]|uniref:hypothetical protein n=1 Tax=Naasia sp. TaxID=2546198 RepID=UPI002618B1C9|nr:hypothetical protein [Naasia sp.]MCU1571424.1 hypothetical protein [Naasia sp.]
MDSGEAIPADAVALAAARRRLEQSAYGPGIAEDDRRRAQDELSRIAAASRRPMLLPTGPGDETLQLGPTPGPMLGEPPRRAAPQLRRLRLRALVASAVVVATLALVVTVVPLLLRADSLDVFSRAQTDDDRDFPMWFSNALATGASASGEVAAGSALHATVRRLTTPDGTGTAFVFTDADAQTVCLAAAAASVACAPAARFRDTGLRVEVIDRTGPAVTGGVRYSWGPRGGLESEPFTLELPVAARAMDGRNWPGLFTGCMAEHDQAVSATLSGEVIVGTDTQARTLSYAMARLECAIRYPLAGYYLPVRSPAD